jgi:hypothetical protein
MKIKCLKVIGDSDLIVSQIKKVFVAKNERLRRYRNVVLDTIELFDAFAIKVVPRERNVVVDALAVATSTLQPCRELVNGECKMEVIFRPSIPDNLEHWQVFNDDAQILHFLHSLKEFSENQVNWQN